MTVLIIDDDLIDRMSIERFCRSNNIFYFSASNGKEALDVISKQKIDLVFSDIDMPEIDGIKFVKIFNKDKILNRIPIIAVSGNEEKDIKRRYIDYGFDYFISKPPMKEQLKYVFSNFLNKTI